MTDLSVSPLAIKISPHARDRMVEMGVEDPEVVDALSDPEIDVPDRNNEGRRLATKARLLVSYVPLGDRREVVTVMWAGVKDRSEGPKVAVPGHPSNRAVCEQLERWGLSAGRRRNDHIQMRRDRMLVEVRPPGFSKGNSQALLAGIYKTLGVTPEEFWSRTEKVRPIRERVHAPRPVPQAPPALPVTVAPEPPPAPTKPRREPRPTSQTGRVLAHFKFHRGEILDATQVADALDLDVGDARLRCGELYRRGHLQRVSRGRYRFLTWGLSDTEKQLIELNGRIAETGDPLERVELIQQRLDLLDRVTDNPPEPESEPVPRRRSGGDDDYDDEIDALFELIAPAGIKARHVDLVARWRNVTRELIEELRQ